MLPNIYTQERVSEYLSRGFAPIPMKHKSKLPVSARWPELRITQNDIPKYFNGHATNIGVLTGEPSQGLVDVDIDDTTALRFAPRFLPETNCIFGRPSKPRSHWIYRVPEPGTHQQFQANGMIVEI